MVGTVAVDLTELQGNIFRSYGRSYRAVRHLVLRVVDPAAARAALAAMTDGDRATPDVTRAQVAPRDADFAWCLNVGITWRGLQALGLPASNLATFPPEFREGMVARAAKLGDVGGSAPDRWLAGLGQADKVHLLVTIHGREPADLAPMAELVTAARGGRAFAAVSPEGLDDGELFGDDREHHVHFGYRDGISQPRFQGIHDDGPIPGQPFNAVGTVLLGHPAPLPGIEWRVPCPDQLGRNGTFNAFRVLGQDVAGFEDFLVASGAALGCSPEEVAAKMCGRWRNGAPLVLAPTEAESHGVRDEDLNRFGYREADADGSRCPIGSHIRRANPRDAHIVQRGTNDVRAVIRRGMPFGPAYDPAGPEQPGVRRGLHGSFLCANLAAQFEAMQADWLNLGFLDPRITGTNDPLMGANDPTTSNAGWTSAAGDAVRLQGIPRFVHTLGGAYCFVPTIPALQWIARAGWNDPVPTRSKTNCS